MADIKTTPKKNIVELYKDINTQIEYIKVNGVKIGVAGFTSEQDREYGMKALQEIIDSIDSTNPYEIARIAMSKLNTLAAITENHITPDEEITVGEGDKFIVSYGAKAAYDMNGEEFANCTDIEGDLPTVAIKAILIERIKNKLKELEDANNNEFADLLDAYMDDLECDDD